MMQKTQAGVLEGFVQYYAVEYLGLLEALATGVTAGLPYETYLQRLPEDTRELLEGADYYHVECDNGDLEVHAVHGETNHWTGIVY